MKKSYLQLITWLGGLMVIASFSVKAQTLIPASKPDQYVTSPGYIGNFYRLNCDMVECPLAGVNLSAIVWSDGTGCHLFADYTGNPTPVTLTIPSPTGNGIGSADVVIGNAHDDPTYQTYVIGVIYAESNYGIYYTWYHVTGIGTPSFAVSYQGTVPLAAAGTINKYPHIDAFADNTAPVGGLPGLHDFVACWHEFDPTGAVNVKSVFTAIDNPAIAPTAYTISGPNSANADVAAVTDINTGNRYAEYAYEASSGVEYAEFDVNTKTVTTTTNFGVNGIPRIEAMSLYDATQSPVPTKYMIAFGISSGSDFFGYNDTYYPSVAGIPLRVASGLFPPTTLFESPAVAAGIGVGGSPANIGNSVYTLGMYADGQNYFYARQIDINTGDYPTMPGGNDYYQINQVAVAGSNLGLAISSSSNSGNDILSVWSDGNNLYRKYSGNMFAFKKALANTTQAPDLISAYPNPAINTLLLKGLAQNAIYTITDVLGRAIQKGTLYPGAAAINIENIPPGIYNLSINENNKQSQLRFAKK